MATIYVYLLETLADWELGYVTAELNSKRFFKKAAPPIVLKTAGASKEPIQTMGGMTITPDCLIEDIMVAEGNVLLLPGADTWNDTRHAAIIEKAREFLKANATVGAICGATAALANAGLLDQRQHTSNGPGFLEMVAPAYQGQHFYVDQPSVADDNLITASSTAALLWAKQIIEQLDIFYTNTLEAWYDYFNTGEEKYFYALLETLPDSNPKN